jgi:hypothetical protein
MDRERKSGRGLGIANALVWGGLTALLGAAALASAAVAFNAASRHGSVKETVVAAGIAAAATAAAAATGKVAKDSAHDVLAKPDGENQELPPYFARLFEKEKGDSPNPPSANPDKPGPAL